MDAGALCPASGAAGRGAAAWGTVHSADDIQQNTTAMAIHTRLLIKALPRRDCLARRQLKTLKSNIYVYWP
jgi:hypothetical protein